MAFIRSFPEKQDLTQPAESKTRDFSDEDDLQPLTEEDLRQYPIELRSYMVSERFQKIREIEARKEVLRDIIQLQYKAKNGERAVQKAITEQDKVTRELLAQSEGKKVEKGPVKKSTAISQAPKEIRRDTNDIELEKVKLKVERTQKNLAENSQLVKSSSAPKTLQGKRKASEPETPLTVNSSNSKIIDLSKSTSTPMPKKVDVEPPLKKSKTNSGAAVVTSTTTATTTKKKSGKKICDGCEKVEEPQLHAQRYPKDGKAYCYACHIYKNNCCSNKPATGGRPCYQQCEDEGTRLCSKHKYTSGTSEIIFDKDSMEE